MPLAYRFDAKEVFIRQDPDTGDVILARKPSTWDGFFAAVKAADKPADFLGEQDRADGHVRTQSRDPFDGYRK